MGATVGDAKQIAELADPDRLSSIRQAVGRDLLEAPPRKPEAESSKREARSGKSEARIEATGRFRNATARIRQQESDSVPDVGGKKLFGPPASSSEELRFGRD